MTAHALRYARDRGYTVVPSCPFVAAYIARHPEYRDLLGVRYASRDSSPTRRMLLLLSIGWHPEFETGVASMQHGGRLQ